MGHSHDLLAIAVALAIMLTVLTYSNLLDPSSVLFRAITAGGRLPAKDRPKARRKGPPYQQ